MNRQKGIISEKIGSLWILYLPKLVLKYQEQKFILLWSVFFCRILVNFYFDLIFFPFVQYKFVIENNNNFFGHNFCILY